MVDPRSLPALTEHYRLNPEEGGEGAIAPAAPLQPELRAPASSPTVPVVPTLEMPAFPPEAPDGALLHETEPSGDTATPPVVHSLEVALDEYTATGSGLAKLEETIGAPLAE